MKVFKHFIFMTSMLILLLVFFYSIFAFNFKMIYMDREYPMWLIVKNNINKKLKRTHDLLAIGDSKLVAGFMPNLSEKDVINLSVSGGTPIEGYYTLKKYLANHPVPPHKILLSYAPFHLEGIEAYWQRTVKFSFLNDADYREIRDIAISINDSKTLGYEHSYLDYKYPQIYFMNVLNGIIHMRWRKNNEVYKEFTHSKGHYFFGRKPSSSELNADINKENFKPNKLIDLYLKNLLTLANNNNITIYWYTMPINKSSFDQTTKNFIDQFDNYIGKLSKEYNIIQLNNLNYMADENFGDYNHLYNGSHTVTNNILNSIYYDNGNK